jgi:transposase InsO family protein
MGRLMQEIWAMAPERRQIDQYAAAPRIPTAWRPRSRSRSWPTRRSIPRPASSASPTSFACAAPRVSPAGVRGVWLRQGLESRHKRLLRLEQHAQDVTHLLSEEQIRLLEQHSVEFRHRHVETSRPGELLNQDTFYWGTLKGVGKVYVRVVVDVFCSLAFAKVYTSKMPATACDLLYERMLPFYAVGVPIGSVLTDNGREFCGKPQSHPYELLLALEGIEHRTTRVRSSRTNGFVERMNRTLLDECFRVEGRETWYLEPAEIQRDLDRFLAYYNLERSHQGYRLRGRTPAQALREALGVEELPPAVPITEEFAQPEAA